MSTLNTTPHEAARQAAEMVPSARSLTIDGREVLLSEELIRYERPGTHRRIPKEALDEYLTAEAGNRKQALDYLADTLDPDVPEEVVSTR